MSQTNAPTLPSLLATRPVWAGLLFLLLVAAYAPVYARMIGDWYADPNYSHGFLVPLVSAWFVHHSLPRLRATPAEPSAWGLLTILAGLCLLALGTAVDELFTTRLSSLVLLAGIIHTLCGGRVLRVLALPLAYLIFMIPLPYTVYDALALPLKGLVSQAATAGIRLLGMPVLREGNMIHFPNISLEVVEACSGLRSLISLLALSTAYAFIMLKGTWRRVALILATIPIAVFANIIRVFITGILARHMGSAAAEGFFHSFAGLAVFGTALAMTALVGWLLGRIGRKGGSAGTGEPNTRQDDSSRGGDHAA